MKDFDAMTNSLRAAAQHFPRCRVASCDCDEFGGEWRQGCHCPGHWQQLDEALGRGGWNLADAAASAKAGKPVRAKETPHEAP